MTSVPTDHTWTRAAPEAMEGHGPWIEIAPGAGGLVYIREISAPVTVVTTTRKKWDAFVLGVKTGEFSQFVTGLEKASRP
ncbi:DUF397 domain-containing protein [Streptomyces sp. NPDC102467]|uniref:DUF397 domain-containing protein n=1 Tax=Streptomyces sp. NPDC102467 TaxID=3366179 RepID=UPI00382F50C7